MNEWSVSKVPNEWLAYPHHPISPLSMVDGDDMQLQVFSAFEVEKVDSCIQHWDEGLGSRLHSGAISEKKLMRKVLG